MNSHAGWLLSCSQFAIDELYLADKHAMFCYLNLGFITVQWSSTVQKTADMSLFANNPDAHAATITAKQRAAIIIGGNGL